MDERSSATILGVEVANPLARADSGFAAPPPTPAATADAGRPDAAVRARLNAIVIDGLILAPILGLLLAGSGGPTRSPKALLLAAVLQFAYFFLLEARSGQTIGKRLCHIRVVGLDGAPITMGQAAVRNGLRFVDALPMLYASGLLSMMRTGAGKRQRIGDVVAGTAIVVVPGGRPLPTPRWLLPVATLLTTAGSICLLVLVLNAPAIPPPAGFTGAVSQRPMPGSWTATATVTSSAGYGNQPVGRSFVRAWVITRACNPRGACGLALTRQLAGAPPPHGCAGPPGRRLARHVSDPAVHMWPRERWPTDLLAPALRIRRGLRRQRTDGPRQRAGLLLRSVVWVRDRRDVVERHPRGGRAGLTDVSRTDPEYADGRD